MNYSDFRENLIIDKDNLDGELERHAFLYMEVGEELAKKTSLRDEAKDELEGIASDISMRIMRRSDSKLSDSKIKSQVMLDADYIEQAEKLSRLKLSVQKWQALYESYRQRGSMLKMLAELYMANYYTSSSVKSLTHSSDDLQLQRARRAARNQRTSRRDEDNSDY